MQDYTLESSNLAAIAVKKGVNIYCAMQQGHIDWKQ